MSITLVKPVTTATSGLYQTVPAEPVANTTGQTTASQSAFSVGINDMSLQHGGLVSAQGLALSRLGVDLQPVMPRQPDGNALSAISPADGVLSSDAGQANSDEGSGAGQSAMHRMMQDLYGAMNTGPDMRTAADVSLQGLISSLQGSPVAGIAYDPLQAGQSRSGVVVENVTASSPRPLFLLRQLHGQQDENLPVTGSRINATA